MDDNERPDFDPAFDPYPFILLNLCLSCLAAIQAPIILMRQNRQEVHDRARGEQAGRQLVGRNGHRRNGRRPARRDATRRHGSNAPRRHARATERHLGDLLELETADGDVAPKELIDDLRGMLAESASILRNDEQLAEGLSELDRLRDRADELGIDGDRTSRDFEFALDLSFMVITAEALLRSARL